MKRCLIYYRWKLLQCYWKISLCGSLKKLLRDAKSLQKCQDSFKASRIQDSYIRKFDKFNSLHNFKLYLRACSPFAMKFLGGLLTALYVAPITGACWVCSDLQGEKRLQVEHMLGIGEEFNPSGVPTCQSDTKRERVRTRDGRTLENNVYDGKLTE